MTQSTLIDLAQRGAKCEVWAKWCKSVLVQDILFTDAVEVSKASLCPSDTIFGPLPSTGYLNDQLGEFLRRADIWFDANLDYFILRGGNDYSLKLIWKPTADIRLITTKLEAAIVLVERAHSLGEYADWTEQQSRPYLKAFNKGIGQ